MSWLLVERLVQVNDDDIGMLRNVKKYVKISTGFPSFILGFGGSA